MAKMSKEEREQLAALQERAQAEEAEESDLRVLARNSKGIEVEYTGSRARAFLARHGFEDPEPEGEDEADEDEADPEPEGEKGYFRKKK